MRKAEFTRREYIRPQIKVIKTETEGLLFKASGDHKPGTVKPNPGDAKQGWFDEDEDEDFQTMDEENGTSYNLWN